MPVEAVDLVIRVGALSDSDLVARRLLTSQAWTCASPGYLAAQGAPPSVSGLTDHVLIANHDRTATWSYGGPDGAMERVEFRPHHVVSDSAVLEPMLVGGAGIGRLPDFLARPAVARGDLVRLFPDLSGDSFDIHALYPSHRSLSAKVRVFVNALIEDLRSASRREA